jgi:hypothetical protein
LESVRAVTDIVGLTPAQTFDVVRRYAGEGGVGPRLYDRLIGEAALAAGLPRIVTWNIGHMRGLFPGLQVLTPPEVVRVMGTRTPRSAPGSRAWWTGLEQRKLRRDQEHAPATPEALLAVVDNGPPNSIDDMRAFLGERVLEVSARMHTTNTDMWDAYWDGDKPRDENHCRNRLIEHISAALPKTVRFEPEMHMPNQKRADIAAIGLPVEIKGQWHAEVWDAVTDQLAALYSRDWRAEGRGVFIVIWFGDAKGKQLTAHPDGLAKPTTPEALRMMLLERIPEQARDLCDVYVVDVSRPAKTP